MNPRSTEAPIQRKPGVCGSAGVLGLAAGLLLAVVQTVAAAGAAATTSTGDSLFEQYEVFTGSAAKNQVYPYDFATQAQYESLLRNGILYLSGKWTAEELTADWDKVDAEYKQQQKEG